MGITIKIKTSASTQATAQKISSAFVGVILKLSFNGIDVFRMDVMFSAVYLRLSICGELLVYSLTIIFYTV
jgi:hypothetical protein